MALKIGAELPEMAGATEWINSTVARSELLGKPVFVHFWSVSCGICSEQMPQVVQWNEALGTRGLQVVGIHMPRSERDTDMVAVREAVQEYGLKHPQAVDNMHAIVDAFENQFVPAFYLFDHEGHMRFFAAGEHGMKMLEGALERVLAKAAEASPGA
jgi:thiol-disulfide isomerase/thioredoxin